MPTSRPVVAASGEDEEEEVMDVQRRMRTRTPRSARGVDNTDWAAAARVRTRAFDAMRFV